MTDDEYITFDSCKIPTQMAEPKLQWTKKLWKAYDSLRRLLLRRLRAGHCSVPHPMCRKCGGSGKVLQVSTLDMICCDCWEPNAETQVSARRRGMSKTTANEEKP